MTRGIFKLQEVVYRKSDDTWVSLDDVWTAPSPSGSPRRFSDNQGPVTQLGYLGGGEDGISFLSSMNKITFTTDTVSAIPATVGARFQLAASSSATAGYFGGGRSPVISSIDKITYSTETSSSSPGTTLSGARYSLSATGNANNGYFGGGTNSSYADITTVDKLTYSIETVAQSPSASLSSVRKKLSAVGNQTVGYFQGGSGSPNSESKIDKITYSTDNTSLVPGLAISGGRYDDAAMGNSTAGYFSGGIAGGGGNTVTSTNKLTYSTDTMAVVPAAYIPAPPGSSSIKAHGAAGGASTGYLAGGQDDSYTPRSSIYKIDYATDTITQPPSTLTQDRYAFGSVSPTSNANPYASPPAATPTPQTVGELRAGGPTTNFGYFVGGGNPALSRADKVTYSTDTTAQSPGASLSFARTGLFGVGNGAYGYFLGGLDNNVSSSPVTNSDRLTYSTDVTAASPALNLSTANSGGGNTGSSTNGYLAGGFSGGYLSSIQKLSYATETISASSGNLTSARGNSAGTGSATIGYFGGGSTGPYSTSLDKLTYSNDSVSAAPSGFVPARATFNNATASSTAAYFGGSVRTPAGANSSVTKVIFSTDVVSNLPATGALKAARYDVSATGNTTHGYFGGGTPARSTQLSFMDKLTYSNDTMAAIPAGYLTASRYGAAAVSPKANNLPGTLPPSTAQVPVIL